MIKIGFVDRYLDNWHSNHYPEYLRLAAQKFGIDADLVYAYAWEDHPQTWGLSTKAWCEMYHCTPCDTYEELIEKCDAIMVMCADDCTPHEELAELALESGKPVYCDKTFAPSVEAADRMFTLAEKNNTPVFSSSAQRFCTELMDFLSANTEKVNFAVSTGPGDIVNYSVHQYEMLEAVLGVGAVRCQAFVQGTTRHLVYQYEDERMCTFTQAAGMPFNLFAGNHDTGVRQIKVSDYYMNFMKAVLQFFTDKIPPVKAEDTMEIMRMQQAARKALETPMEWVRIER